MDIVKYADSLQKWLAARSSHAQKRIKVRAPYDRQMSEPGLQSARHALRG